MGRDRNGDFRPSGPKGFPQGPRGNRDTRDTRDTRENRDTRDRNFEQRSYDYESRHYGGRGRYDDRRANNDYEYRRSSAYRPARDNRNQSSGYSMRDGRSDYNDLDNRRDSRRDRDRDRDRDRGRDTRGNYRLEREKEEKKENKNEENDEVDEDLSQVVSLDKIERPSNSLWDVAPKGFEKIPAVRAKAVGLFQKPGSKKLNIDYSRVLRLLHEREEDVSKAGKLSTISLENSKMNLIRSHISKNVIVSNVDFTKFKAEDVSAYFNRFLTNLNIEDHENKDDVVSSQRLSSDGTNLIIEFINASLATIAVSLDGQFVEALDCNLKISRPEEYITPIPLKKSESENVIEGIKKFSISNIPTDAIEKDIQDHLKQVTGTEIIAFKLLRHSLTNDSTGLAFVEFADDDLSTTIIDKISNNKFQNTNDNLKAKRICASSYKQDEFITYETLISAVIGQGVSIHNPSKIVQFSNCIDVPELNNDIIYEGIKQDFYNHCSTFGQVIEVLIPRPTTTQRDKAELEPGVGQIYIKFNSLEGSSKAFEALAGCRFGERTVLTSYFSEADYNIQLW
ncbi:hypothetical protein PACTADRAFT_982 [Pachysolen tannophilus NRRL Y-2460]|uniref:RRM domain-containing protein n=1 Tax=Pachysolen tannophilus NRRL Y-2460 TaxID=669874 RepID=A0A1E4U3F1_PACTA|nr:hypothetical protein PACTADRAFT_982 [Pachysolen tannophilus NRRL Y-2460]